VQIDVTDKTRNPFEPVIQAMLDAGEPGEGVATVLLASAGDLAAAYTRSEEQCVALCRSLAETMERHALRQFRVAERAD
jgi:hypothetical protein